VHSVGYALSAAEGAWHETRPLRERFGANLTLSEQLRYDGRGYVRIEKEAMHR
jgi:hypothetical protein